MSIKHAVLGLLAHKPSHGYALLGIFEREVGMCWDLNYGQVYQILSALERDGLVVGHDERCGNRPPRRVYSTTAKGSTELTRWLTLPPPGPKPFRDEFFVRLLVATSQGRVVLHRLLLNELQDCRAHVGELSRSSPLTNRNSSDGVVPRLLAEAALMHARTDLEILEHCSRVLGLEVAPALVQSRRS